MRYTFAFSSLKLPYFFARVKCQGVQMPEATKTGLCECRADKRKILFPFRLMLLTFCLR